MKQHLVQQYNYYSFDNCKMVATGDFRVMINDVPVKWCTNGCIPYSQSNDVLVDRNGMFWCNKQTTFTCKSKKCHCRKLEDILITKTKILIAYITDTVIFSSPINLEKLETISIIGHNRSTVICTNGSGVSLRNCKSSIIEGITWIGCGDFSTFKNQSVLSIYESNVTINNCSFLNSLGVAIEVDIENAEVGISNCNFMNNNHYMDHGGCIKYIIRHDNYYLKY